MRNYQDATSKSYFLRELKCDLLSSYLGNAQRLFFVCDTFGHGSPFSSLPSMGFVPDAMTNILKLLFLFGILFFLFLFLFFLFLWWGKGCGVVLFSFSLLYYSQFLLLVEIMIQDSFQRRENTVLHNWGVPKNQLCYWCGLLAIYFMQ